ncbi:tetratricopeptide repeat protein, partial [Aestuariivirga sp.]|uniref:tetratricopeptide repeat protein n=1 Tax=Aestuariivirga sp. TaxID=2650926 RepID=UPI00391BFE4F
MKPIAAALALLLLATPAGAAPIDDARAAYAKGDYAQAFAAAQELAKAGDARAMTLLGLMYRKGRGTAADTDTAITWFTGAGEKGEAEAQLALGLIYLDEQGGRFDYDKGASWLRRAAEAGLAEAQFNMGLL